MEDKDEGVTVTFHAPSGEFTMGIDTLLDCLAAQSEGVDDSRIGEWRSEEYRRWLGSTMQGAV